MSDTNRIIELNEQNKLEFLKFSVLGERACISFSIWSKLFRCDLIRKCYQNVPDDASYGEDLINLCICIINCDRILLLDKAYYYYRNREGSLTRQKSVINIKNVFKLYKNIRVVLECYNSYEELEDSIVNYLCSELISVFQKEFQIPKYCYNNIDLLQGKRIVIYGAGAVGRDYYSQISRYTDCTIVAWVDGQPKKYNYPYIKLQGLEILETISFDVLIIAVKQESVAREIRNQLIEKKIRMEKIFWSKPKNVLSLYKMFH